MHTYQDESSFWRWLLDNASFHPVNKNLTLEVLTERCSFEDSETFALSSSTQSCKLLDLSADKSLQKKKAHHRLRSYPWQSSWFPVTVQHLKGHKSTIYMARRFTTLVGLSTHTHLHARVHRVYGFMQRYTLRRMDHSTFSKTVSV